MKRGKNVDGFMLNKATNPKLIVEDDDGFWRLYELSDPGYPTLYRAYHKHTDGWVSQLTLFPVCAKCRTPAPEAMDGFEKLIRWRQHEED